MKTQLTIVELSNKLVESGSYRKSGDRIVKTKSEDQIRCKNFQFSL
jgi:hypothetical protein